MKSLEQLLAEWEDGTLTPGSAAELKQCLATREARAELVGDWLLHEAVYGTLRAERGELPSAAAESRATESTRFAPQAGRRTEPSWLKRWMPRLVWHEVHLSLRLAGGAVVAVGLLWLAVYFYFRSSAVAQVAELEGPVSVERSGRRLSIQNGQWLYPRDLLRVPENSTVVLAWTSEATRVALAAGSEFKVLGQMLGKRLKLQSGRLQATVAPQPPWRPLIVSTPQAEVTVAGTRFSLAVDPGATRLEVVEGAVALSKKLLASATDKRTVTVRSGQFAVASPQAILQTQSLQAFPGWALREVLAFPADSALFASSDGTVLASDLIQTLTVFPDVSPPRGGPAPTNRYEDRIQCFIKPPVTGDYTFWIHSGQSSELWLSPDDQPAHRRKIASVPLLAPLPRQPGGFTLKSGPFTWQLPPRKAERHPDQKSAPQRLTADTPYYLEVLHPYATNDFVMVMWSKPGEPNQAPSSVVGGPALSPFFATNSPSPRNPNR